MNVNNRTSRWAVLVCGVVVPALLYATALSVARGLDDRRSLVERLGGDPDTFDLAQFQDTLTPQRAKELGLLSLHQATEVVVVVVTSSGCVASRDRAFRRAIRQLPGVLDARFAERPEVVVRMVGLGLDWDIDRGFEHLKDLGRFDEIIVGGNRLNVAAEKYLWGEYRLGGGTPQILVLQRAVRWHERGVEVGGESPWVHLVGPRTIAGWVEEGAPLPASLLADSVTTGVRETFDSLGPVPDAPTPPRPHVRPDQSSAGGRTSP